MKQLRKKNELAFALVWIGVYLAFGSLAGRLSERLGVRYAAQAVGHVLLSLVLWGCLLKNGLGRRYGLCRSPLPARRFLWYLPLAALASVNLWLGVRMNLPPRELACCLISMGCVGFLEELLFRGLLFRALQKGGLKRAVVISSVSFGLGHLLNLLGGGGDPLSAALQVVTAAAVGFLFVLIFLRGGSLLPCILTHSLIDMSSVFANESALTPAIHVALTVAELTLTGLYLLFLLRTLPPAAAAGPTE